MSSNPIPKLSIGLPVYNGENFIAQAIDCHLNQTFTDFELIISDNASTDRTGDICRAYAAKDKRIRYTRNAENIGLVRNYNQVFTLSAGVYFKWADHDDMCRETLVERCVHVLDAHPEVVLAFSRALTIDANGTPIKEWQPRPELTAPQVERRIRRALKQDEPFPLQCVMRAGVLKKTGLLGKFPESDHVLLAELALYGPFAEIPEPLFLIREHQQRTIRRHNWQNPQSVLSWLDPASKNVLPELGLVADLVAAVRRAPLSPRAQWRSYRELYVWAKSRKDGLARDLLAVPGKVPGLGTLINRSYQKWKQSNWRTSLRRSARDVASVVPVKSRFILVDDAMCPTGVFGDRQTTPFLERNGEYCGSPPSDDVAIREFERLRESGASFLVFTWLTFWWIEHYSDFYKYVCSKFRCVLRNDRVVVFDLRQSF